MIVPRNTPPVVATRRSKMTHCNINSFVIDSCSALAAKKRMVEKRKAKRTRDTKRAPLQHPYYYTRLHDPEIRIRLL